ncbi:MAG: hypothetical protein M1838_002560 [Thelocarpon superellum]|nr:MAG: hypothetical protein M1838_002560 [Thelocarpon superellum]
MLPQTLSQSLSALTDLVRQTTGSVTWGPLVNLSRNAVCTLLSRIELGQLRIVDTDGSALRFGETSHGAKSPTVELTVRREAFWVRLCLFTDMGFAEAFMLGDVDCPDLEAFFELFILNRPHLNNGTNFTSSLTSALSAGINRVARNTNTLSNALLNVSAHYDISNEMFAAFLSDDMTYSCPIWAPKSSPQSLTETLEQAQKTKLQRFIRNAKIKGTDHVLEIGTGWGSFAIEAVRSTGCTVTSLTLSVEQKELAEKRIAAAGYTDWITVLLCDYRALPIPELLYDKVVSIEMLEAVGREFLVTYFECVNRLLKPDGGIAVFQCITMPECRYENYSRSEDFIRKYIFPGGHLPSVSQLVRSIDEGSKGTLIVDQVENISGHYSKTLRLWKQKFLQNFDARIKPALLDEHDDMTDEAAELFKRKWEYYFTYSEAGFATKTLGDVIITVGREGAMEMLEDINL